MAKRHSKQQIQAMKGRMIQLFKRGTTRKEAAEDVGISIRQSYDIIDKYEAKECQAKGEMARAEYTPDAEQEELRKAIYDSAMSGEGSSQRLLAQINGMLDGGKSAEVPGIYEQLKGKGQSQIINLILDGIAGIGDGRIFLEQILQHVSDDELRTSRKAREVSQESEADSGVSGGEQVGEDIRTEAGSVLDGEGGPIQAGVCDTPVPGDKATS